MGSAEYMGATMRALRCVLLICAVTSSYAYLNLNGTTLKSCSGPGEALTGFTRTGHCVAHNDDAGSHHVCIDMSSNTGGNFCEVTGQPDWCSSSMQCHNGGGSCKIKHWCVCEWAFARYIQAAGGCDKIQKISCEATNLVAAKHYRMRAGSSPEIQQALDCLEQRCNPPKDRSVANDTL